MIRAPKKLPKYLKTTTFFEYKIENPQSQIFSFSNINSVRNKFDNVLDGWKSWLYCSSRNKTAHAFPLAHFPNNGYNKPYRLGITPQKGGLLADIASTISDRISLQVTVFMWKFDSPQVKRNLIPTIINFLFKLPHELITLSNFLQTSTS